MTTAVSSLPGQDTLLACWQALARLSPGARLIRSATTRAAVFPAWAPLNNAILLDSEDAVARAASVAELTRVYAGAGVGVWALWISSRTPDLDAPDQVLDVGGLKRDTTTLVMRTRFAQPVRLHDGVVQTSIAAATRAAGDRPVPVAELAEPDRQPGLSAWVLVRDGFAVAGAWSFLRGLDCGIYTVGTVPEWRRQGLARTLMQHVLADARRRGARTATLQSTRMGQPLYESLGFEPVGRYEEWISHDEARTA
jgi:GNAT superfamily N-acetyltransferase